MKLRIGTSGFSIKPADMLGFYAERLGAAEINNTFYRMPRASVLEGWASQVPPDFRFVLKVSQKITHYKRLRGVQEETAYLTDVVGALGGKLGSLLVQLPPNFKKDLDRLGPFLELLEGVAAAVEFRHPSWFDEETFGLLRRHDCAPVTSQTEETPDPPFAPTAGWGYLRLRRDGYTDDGLAEWKARIAAQPWDQAYVFFKHEQIAPDLAARLAADASS